MNSPLSDHGVTNKLVERLSGPVGMVIINWAMIDQSLSGITAATAETVEQAGEKVRRARNFQPKLDYLRDVVFRLPALESYGNRAAKIFEGIERVKPIRDAFSHGTISHYLADEEIIEFVKVNPAREEDIHEAETVRISIHNIDAAADISLKMANDIGRLAIELCEDLLAD